ncbi:MAG: hypothetical protein ACLFPA_06920, partial [Dichotomicrobium sp.]
PRARATSRDVLLCARLAATSTGLETALTLTQRLRQEFLNHVRDTQEDAEVSRGDTCATR